MIQLQIISKILQTQDASILTDNLIDTDDYFVGYTDELHFIQDHIKQYGNVPDKATFLSKFPEIELVEVAESDEYLVNTVREEYLYYKSIPIVQRVAELLKTDSNSAVEYMINSMKNLQPTYSLNGVDIIQQATDRLEQFIDRQSNQDSWFFTTGFKELDDIIYGIQRQEELFVLFARTNQGKSWVLEKICTHIWEIGFNVGYISPEMSANSIGFRFDTLYQNFSNKGLMWGNNDIEVDKYKEYIDSLKSHNNKFIVATPLDFDKKITVSKLKNFVKQHSLDVLAIDGITYLTDERFKRGDTKTVSLTNISEDLIALSMEVQVPILVVVQANRNGVQQESTGTPELETIRDSDGIAQNATKVISIRQTDEGLELGIKKQRFGSVGGKLLYRWNINEGDFQFIPSYGDAQPHEETERRVREVKKKYADKSDVF